MAVSNFAGEKDFPVEQPEESALQKMFTAIERKNQMPTESEITDILRQMGKRTPADELNCGSCGYNTCREKQSPLSGQGGSVHVSALSEG